MPRKSKRGDTRGDMRKSGGDCGPQKQSLPYRPNLCAPRLNLAVSMPQRNTEEVTQEGCLREVEHGVELTGMGEVWVEGTCKIWRDW